MKRVPLEILQCLRRSWESIQLAQRAGYPRAGAGGSTSFAWGGGDPLTGTGASLGNRKGKNFELASGRDGFLGNSDVSYCLQFGIITEKSSLRRDIPSALQTPFPTIHKDSNRLMCNGGDLHRCSDSAHHLPYDAGEHDSSSKYGYTRSLRSRASGKPLLIQKGVVLRTSGIAKWSEEKPVMFLAR